jgi:hypothetical protein
MHFNLGCLMVATAASLSWSEIIQGMVSSTLEIPLDSVKVTVKDAPGATAFSDAKGAFTLNTAITGLHPTLNPFWRNHQGEYVARHSLNGQWLGPSDARPAGVYFGFAPSTLGTGLAKRAAAVTLVFEKAGFVKKEAVSPADASAMQVVLEYSDLRLKAKTDYQKSYVGSNVTLAELAWTGDTATCNAGTVSQLSQTRSLLRLNYFRRMVGLTPVTFVAALNSKCQQAALMMTANKALNHSPPTTWRCYTQEGADGAGSSNLSGGSHSSAAMTQYMRDEGGNNTFVGHRRWILYPLLLEMGSGSTGSNNALATFGKRMAAYPASMPAFVAWPAAGYFPYPLVAPRWSFSVHNNADLSAAQVVMTGPDGKAMPQTLLPYVKGYGEPTIVWEPAGIDVKNPADAVYSITVTGVKGGRPDGAYAYQVTLFQP